MRERNGGATGFLFMHQGGYAASHRAVRELKANGLLPADTKLRASKYLNKLIEQDHRSVKQQIAVMLG